MNNVQHLFCNFCWTELLPALRLVAVSLVYCHSTVSGTADIFISAGKIQKWKNILYRLEKYWNEQIFSYWMEKYRNEKILYIGWKNTEMNKYFISAGKIQKWTNIFISDGKIQKWTNILYRLEKCRNEQIF